VAEIISGKADEKIAPFKTKYSFRGLTLPDKKTYNYFRGNIFQQVKAKTAAKR